MINVKDHGVTGDGVTDDAPAIQNVIDNIASDGDTIYFPASSYLLGAGLTLPSYRTIAGDGPERSVLVLGATVPGEEKLLHMANVSDIRIRDIGFDGMGGAKTYDAEGELIHATYIQRAIISNVAVRNAVSEGIDLDHPTDVLIENLHAEDCGGNAVHAGATNDALRVTVRKAYAVNCSHRRFLAGKANPYAFKISGDYNTIEDVFAENCANGVGTIFGMGSHIKSSTVIGGAIGFHGGGATVTDCTAEGCTSRGVSSAEAAIGNDVIGIGITNVGISVTSNKAIVLGNRVSDIEFTAISVSSPNAPTGTIANNIIDGSGQYAVHIVDPANEWSVLGNYHKGQAVSFPLGTISANNRA